MLKEYTTRSNSAFFIQHSNDNFVQTKVIPRRIGNAMFNSIIIEHRVINSARNFTKLCFSDVTKNLKRRIANGTESNRLNVFLPIRLIIVKQDLGHLYVTTSSSHFFNISDLLKM